MIRRNCEVMQHQKVTSRRILLLIAPAITLLSVLIIDVVPGQTVSSSSARTILHGDSITAVSSDQADGSVWVLKDDGGAKSIAKVDISTGNVISSESVSRQATTVAQNAAGDVAVGTANGKSSGVVLYSGTDAKYLATVSSGTPVLALAMSGPIVYGIHGDKSRRSLFTFDTTLTGFSFPVAPNAISVAPEAGGAAIWVLCSNDSAYKLTFFPRHASRPISVSRNARSLAISPDGRTLYVLSQPDGKAADRIEAFTSASGRSTSSFEAPLDSRSIVTDLNGTSLFDVVSGPLGGLVDIPIGS
jgi:hypothetical protein